MKDFAHRLIDRFAEKERQILSKEFVAPYAGGSRALVLIDGIKYQFKVTGVKGSGVAVFRPTSPSAAQFVRVASPEECLSLLKSLPGVALVLCYETDKGWVATKENQTLSRVPADALVYNVSHSMRFDHIWARWDGSNAWYESYVPSADPMKAEYMRERFKDGMQANKFNLNELADITPADRRAFELAIESWKLFAKQNTEERIKEILSRTGGSLDSYVVRDENLEVRWRSASGESYTSVVQKDTYDVVTAGICLDGLDHTFNLWDLPDVVREGEDRGVIYRTYGRR